MLLYKKQIELLKRGALAPLFVELYYCCGGVVVGVIGGVRILVTSGVTITIGGV